MWVDLAVITVVTAVLLIPFSSKAFHMDDPLFVWAAKNIQKKPLDPYGFSVNWYRTEREMSEVTKNPPMASYYMAVAALATGWNERPLHLVFLLPAIALAFGTYFLARLLCPLPLLASLAAMTTPVFLVASTTLMCDVMMTAFWVWTIWAWMEGAESHAPRLLVLAGLLGAAAALTKYYGIVLVPLLFAYSCAREGRLGRWAAYLAIPCVIVVAYQLGTSTLYAHGLIGDAALYALKAPRAAVSVPAKAWIGLSFLGGCSFLTLLWSRLMWSRRSLLAGVVVALLGALLGASLTTIGYSEMPAAGAARWLAAVQLGLFTATGAFILVLAMTDWMRRRTPDALLLGLWIAGTFLFASFLNWSTNGRSILPMVPAVAILVVRRLDARGTSQPPRTARLIPHFAVSLALALAVALADFRIANASRTAAAEIWQRCRSAGGSVWFQGHWGFQYYMEGLGAKPTDARKSVVGASDLVVVPRNNSNIFNLPKEEFRIQSTLEFRSSTWMSTLNDKIGAGFYSDIWGPLPYAFGAVPPERFDIYTVIGRGTASAVH